MSHIRLPGKRLIKCKPCGGAGFTLIEGYEYICNSCGGKKKETRDVLVDIETLATKIEEKINGKEKKSEG